MTDQILLGMLMGIPLAGFIFNGIRFKSQNQRLSFIVANAISYICFFISIGLVIQLIGKPEDERRILVHFFDWVNIENFSVPISFVVDPTSALVLLLVAGISCFVCLSRLSLVSKVGHTSMSFAWLSLSLMNMLILVLGDNLLLMFLGWSGISLCDYFNMGFCCSQPRSTSREARTFIVNRVGDVGLLLGIMILFLNFGAVGFFDLADRLPETVDVEWTGPVSLASLFLLVGILIKSVHVPVQICFSNSGSGKITGSGYVLASLTVLAGIYAIMRLRELFILAPVEVIFGAVMGGIIVLVASTEFFSRKLATSVVDFSRGLWFYIEINFIDKLTLVLGELVRGAGDFIKNLQNGSLQQYALYISLGIVITMTYILMGT